MPSPSGSDSEPVDAVTRHLTPSSLVERALELVDDEGVGALSMRRLARELGVTPMALYWHFRTKEALLDALADRVYAEVDTDVADGQGWRQAFEALLRSIAAAVRAHPSAATLLATYGETGEHRLRVVEAGLEALHRAGFPPARATLIAGEALSTVIAAGRDRLARSEPTEEQRRLRAHLESLPADRFPRTIAAAGPLSRCEPPEVYDEFGLTLLLAGIERLGTEED